MKILVVRKIYTKRSTIGDLFINGNLFCHTLEDVCRDENRDGDLLDPGETKVHGKTAIPAGTYEVILNVSNRFKKYMPLLLKVPGFEGIRIHNGNTPEHTEGCLLVGSTVAPDFVGNSKMTFEKLMVWLRGAERNEKISITIKDAPRV